MRSQGKSLALKLGRQADTENYAILEQKHPWEPVVTVSFIEHLMSGYQEKITRHPKRQRQQNIRPFQAHTEHSPRRTSFWDIKHLNTFKRIEIIQCRLSRHMELT